MTCRRRGPKGCQCQCNFTAGFAYNAGSCTVQFAVGDIFVDGSQVNPADADLTVVIEGPDGVQDGIVDFGNSLFWEEWQPAQNAVYTSTVTLVCGETTVTREYSFTIPSDANQACNCCTLRNLDYITVSGLDGDAVIGNGTHAVTSKTINTPIGNPCGYNFANIPFGSGVPDFPCGNPEGGTSTTALYQCENALGVKFYLYDPQFQFNRMEVTSTGVVTIRLTLDYRVYRYDLALSPACGVSGTPFRIAWEFTGECENGPLTLASTTNLLNRCTSGNPLTPATPTVELFFE